MSPALEQVQDVLLERLLDELEVEQCRDVRAPRARVLLLRRPVPIQTKESWTNSSAD